MTYSATWPAIGWRTKGHAIDLHNAYNERHKAKNNGSAWGSILTSGTISGWCGPAERLVHAAVASQLSDTSDGWGDPSLTITSQTSKAALWLDQIADVGEWANIGFIYDKINEMTLEVVEDSATRADVDTFVDDSLDYSSGTESSWTDLKTAIAAVLSGTSATESENFIPSATRKIFTIEDDNGNWSFILTCDNADLTLNQIWTGANSQLSLYGLPGTEGVDLDALDNQGTGLTLVSGQFALIASQSAAATSSRSERALNENPPSYPDYYDDAVVQDPGPGGVADYIIGFTFSSVVWINDWSVTGGFDYV